VPDDAPFVPWATQRRFPIFYHHLDILQHLNHASYFLFMETLRVDYYLPFLKSTNPADLDIIIAEADCRYFLPVKYGDELIGEVAPAKPLGKTSFSLLYRFRTSDGSKVVARGRTVIVCYDYQQGTKKKIPADRRARMERDSVDPASEGWT
jgi:YbgC/YbaW family acyl-CoA thioester hydrolase